MRRSPTVLGLVLAALAWPVAVYAVGGAFTDDDTSIFEADIEWLADNGITKGCNPEGTLFCPNEDVTRGQMAAFLHRFAESGAAHGLDTDRLYLSWKRWNPEETDAASVTCEPGDVFVSGYAVGGSPTLSTGYQLESQGPIPVPDEVWTTPTTFVNQPTVSGRSDVQFTGWTGSSVPAAYGVLFRSFAVLAYCLDES